MPTHEPDPKRMIRVRGGKKGVRFITLEDWLKERKERKEKRKPG